MPSKKPRRIVIWCSEEVYRAFKRYAADYRNYEEALISLLEKAGVSVKRFEIV